MKSKTPFKLDGEIKLAAVSQRQMAAALGLSQTRINQMIDEGVMIRDESRVDGRLMLFDSLQNYFLSKNTTGDGVNFWKEKGLHEKAKRELAELKLAKSRGELYEASTVENVMIEQLSNFRTKLLGLPSKYAPQFEGKNRGEIFDALTAAIEECLMELAENYKTADLKTDYAPIELETEQ